MSGFPLSKIGCKEVIREIPLYCYGEVSSALEERLEAHFAECDACRAELAKHREFLEALDERADLPESLLAECRNTLRANLAAETALKQSRGALARCIDGINRILDIHVPFRVPVTAAALIAIGFFGARYTPARFGGVQADVAAAPMFSSVRSIEPDASGHVQIAVDDVRRHMVVGNLHDPQIEDLLLSAIREESNPGVRLQSIRILRSTGDAAQVQRALMDAVSQDPDANVRLNAIEGLQQYAGDSVVRKTLANVLLRDDDPGVRVRAIDVLTAQHQGSPGESIVPIVGLLQDVIEKEDNSYVRQHTQDLLQAMRASVGIY